MRSPIHRVPPDIGQSLTIRWQFRWQFLWQNIGHIKRRAVAQGIARLRHSREHIFAQRIRAAGGRGLFGAATLWLSCENGSDDPIHLIAVSDEGDLVTDHLVLGQRRGVHMRLVTMGEGYRGHLSLWQNRFEKLVALA